MEDVTMFKILLGVILLGFLLFCAVVLLRRPGDKPCRGIGGWLFGHDYRPRFSVERKHTCPVWGPPEVMRAAADETRTYHDDVCRRCGDTVNHQGTDDG